MIRNLQDLAHEVGAARDASTGATDEETGKSIARRLFKDTDCGISFWHNVDGVVVTGYCEGSDDYIEGHSLGFPFDTKKFWEAVSQADEDGCNTWDRTHGCEACGDEVDGVISVNPDCKECGGSGEIL